MDFEMRFLDEGALGEIMELQEAIAVHLPDPEIFMLHDIGFFREVLRLDRSVIGIIAEGRLAAYSLIRVPGEAPDNLGRDVGLQEGLLMRVAHLQAAAVHPSCRGQGWQRMMARAHLDVIAGMEIDHVCCTVSPKNPISLGNILSCGFVIKSLRPKFGGWLRYILYRDMSWPKVPPHMASGELLEVALSDVTAQERLLSQGFLGVKIEGPSERASAFFQKRLMISEKCSKVSEDDRRSNFGQHSKD